MTRLSRRPAGFTLVELMVALAIGLVMIAAAISVYVAQSRVYKTVNSQGSIQAAENAIAALMMPTIRAAGFAGCGALGSAVSNLLPGGPPPLGNLGNAPAFVAGYGYVNPAAPGPLAISANPANDPNVAHWSPPLDASLAGQIAPGSDVLVVLGALPGSQPVSVSNPVQPADATLTVQSASALPAAPAFAAVSDCGKSAVFQISSVSGQVLSHAPGAQPLANASAALGLGFQAGSQLVPIQQTAFYVQSGSTNGQTGGQSVLMRATLNADGTSWTQAELVPGVDAMQVLYGTGSAGQMTRYVPASAVTDWSAVYSLRLAFLIEGQPGSANLGSVNANTLLATGFTPPNDTRLRRVYELTVDLRNAQ